MTKLYTNEVQAQLIAQLKQGKLENLDFSTYQSPVKFLKTFTEGHRGRVDILAWLGGNRVVSGSFDNTLKVWDVERGVCERTLVGHSKYVTEVAWLGGSRVVSGSYDGTLKIWDVETGICERTLEGHTGTVGTVAWLGGNRVISGSMDELLKVWDIEKGICERTLEGHSGPVYDVLWLGGNRVISVSGVKLKVWDVEKGICERTMTGHTGHVSELIWLGESRAVSSGYDGTLKVWDVEEGICERTLQGHGGAVWRMVWLGDSRVVSGSYDGKLKVWDVEKGICERTLQGHGGAVWRMLWLGESRVMSGSGEDRTLKIWNVENGECEQSEVVDRMLSAAVMLPNSRLVFGMDYGALQLYEASKGLRYEEIVPVLKAISSPLKNLSLKGVQLEGENLVQVQRLIREENVLQVLNLEGTGLIFEQEQAICQVFMEMQIKDKYQPRGLMTLFGLTHQPYFDRHPCLGLAGKHQALSQQVEKMEKASTPSAPMLFGLTFGGLVISLILLGLLMAIGYLIIQIQRLRRERTDIFRQIQQLEARPQVAVVNPLLPEAVVNIEEQNPRLVAGDPELLEPQLERLFFGPGEGNEIAGEGAQVLDSLPERLEAIKSALTAKDKQKLADYLQPDNQDIWFVVVTDLLGSQKLELLNWLLTEFSRTNWEQVLQRCSVTNWFEQIDHLLPKQEAVEIGNVFLEAIEQKFNINLKQLVLSLLNHDFDHSSKLLLQVALNRLGSIDSRIDVDGNTALHLAVENNNCRLVEFLLELDANPSIKNNIGEKPKHIAATNNFDFEGCLANIRIGHALRQYGFLQQANAIHEIPVQPVQETEQKNNSFV